MIITLNGKQTEIENQSAFEVRDEVGTTSDIVILNGFQIDQDHKLAEFDILSIIRKGTMPKQDELESTMMARHTPSVHNKVKAGKVAIAGLGGLGSNIAVMLARIGVRQLLLVDFDIVEPSNLNRQSYYVRHLGMPKTLALQEQIKEINPSIQVNTETIKITAENVQELFHECDIICEAFDKPDQKSMLVNAALEQLPSVQVVSASGMAGFDSSNKIKTTNPMKRLYLCGDLENSAGIGNGLMAPRVQICAGHQANMTLRLLLGEKDI